MKIKVLNYEVEVTARAQNKRLRLRIVPPNGEIKVSCPIGTPTRVVEKFVLDNVQWVQKNKDKILKEPNSSNYLNNGENLILFNRSYKVIEIPENKYSLNIGNEIAILGAPKSSTREQKVSFIKKYLLQIAKQEFPPRVDYYERIIGVKCSKIGYRYMTSRWGSCNTRSKQINFSVYAVQKSKEYLDYLVAHELMHLVYPNHGKEFKDGLRKIIPNADIVAKQR